MSAVDVSVEIDVAAEPTDVAGVMFDPAREPEWIAAVTGVEVIDPALAAGARVRHRGRFLGQEIAWMTEVASFHFPHQLTLRVTDGPFTGTVQYEVQRGATGSVARIRSTGQPTKLGFLPASIIESQMRSALAADLGRLKQLVEGGP
jgi:uncharacterized membrane protein